VASACPHCETVLKRPWFSREFDCPTCGATLRVDDAAAKNFIYWTEAILIAVGVFSSSSETFLLLGLLAIVALVVYVAWSIRSPLRIAQIPAKPVANA
jgi:hypothetical protein